LEYIARYRKYYPADSREDVWCEIAMAEGYAMIAAAMSLDSWLQFSGISISDGAYLRQEVERIMKAKKP
jgi:hypothetical protein